MDLADIFPIIMALVFAIGLPLALKMRRKGGPKKPDELHQHLQSIGVEASLVDEGSNQETLPKRSRGQKLEGAVRVKDRNMDFISVISESSQYGTNYFLEYQVKANRLMRKEATRKTRMTRKKSPPLWGKVSDIEWKGDPYLAQRLNYDYELKYKLLHAEPKLLKGSISIHPQPKHGYTRIRTNYQLPSPDLFEAIDSIAKHVKSWA